MLYSSSTSTAIYRTAISRLCSPSATSRNLFSNFITSLFLQHHCRTLAATSNNDNFSQNDAIFAASSAAFSHRHHHAAPLPHFLVTFAASSGLHPLVILTAFSRHHFRGIIAAFLQHPCCTFGASLPHFCSTSAASLEYHCRNLQHPFCNFGASLPHF